MEIEVTLLAISSLMSLIFDRNELSRNLYYLHSNASNYKDGADIDIRGVNRWFFFVFVTQILVTDNFLFVLIIFFLKQLVL
jgi:hypothetical protein